jgi:hypothetical protein
MRLYSFSNRVSMRIEWRRGQAKRNESQKRGVKAPPTTQWLTLYSNHEDYESKVRITSRSPACPVQGLDMWGLK